MSIPEARHCPDEAEGVTGVATGNTSRHNAAAILSFGFEKARFMRDNIETNVYFIELVQLNTCLMNIMFLRAKTENKSF